MFFFPLPVCSMRSATCWLLSPYPPGTYLTPPHLPLSQVRRFYRPEDIGNKDVMYAADWFEVYIGPETTSTVDVDKLVGKCSIKLLGGDNTKKPGEGRTQKGTSGNLIREMEAGLQTVRWQD